MSRSYYFKERIKLQIAVVALWVIIPTLAYCSRVEVDYSSFVGFFFISGVCYSLAFLMILIKDRYVAPIAEALGAGFALIVPMFIATYLAYSLDFPLADKQLMAMDQALGFDWLAFVRLVDKSPALSNWLELAYASLKYQLILAPTVLCCSGQVPRAITYIFGYALMVLIASLVAIPFPALGTYSVYGLDIATLQNIDTKFGFHFLSEFNSLRDGSAFTLSSESVAGIVTFPSVHAGMGFLTIWALWQTKWLKWPCLVLNLSMAVSAISHANHYLVDVVAGLGIAGLVAIVGGHIFLGHRFSWPVNKRKTCEIPAVS